jgi:hypothetical protein
VASARSFLSGFSHSGRLPGALLNSVVHCFGPAIEVLSEAVGCRGDDVRDREVDVDPALSGGARPLFSPEIGSVRVRPAPVAGTTRPVAGDLRGDMVPSSGLNATRLRADAYLDDDGAVRLGSSTGQFDAASSIWGVGEVVALSLLGGSVPESTPIVREDDDGASRHA